MKNWRLDLVAVLVVERVLGFFQGFLTLFGLFFQTLLAMFSVLFKGLSFIMSKRPSLGSRGCGALLTHPRASNRNRSSLHDDARGHKTVAGGCVLHRERDAKGNLIDRYRRAGFIHDSRLFCH